MINLNAFLADVDVEEYVQERATEVGMPHPGHGTTLLFGVLGALTLALFLVAYLLRRKRLIGLQRSPHQSSFSKREFQKNIAASQNQRRRKWRRRRREHRPRNPTLAETGGLPPIRSEDRPPPAF